MSRLTSESCILFCAASFIDHRKYDACKKSYNDIRNISDKLCNEYSLTVLKHSQERGRSYAEYAADREDSGSWKSKLKVAIDSYIPRSSDFDCFLRILETDGY